VSKPALSPVLGIMSGTSLDGVDCVVTGFGADGRARLVRHWSKSFPRALRARLLACASGGGTAWECGQLHHDLGRFYAAVAASGLDGLRIRAVGLHGQTLYHNPSPAAPATFQLGEPAYLAEALRVPVVANFRAADLAAGGQGAPLATLFHVRTFAQRGAHVCVQNLGGIGNVTSIDWRRGTKPRVLSFDTGPGNMLIDAAVRRLTGGKSAMDRGGRIAARGMASAEFVRAWMRLPYFRQAPPKSTGRELFGEPYLGERWAEMEAAGLAKADRIATLTEFTAQSVADACRRHLPSMPDRIVLCGGGARNPQLLRRIRAAIAGSSPVAVVESCADSGWPPETLEAAAFALLARERLLGRPGNIPSTTGARRAVSCGQIVEASLTRPK
jgi:anhydro-N-acetylmuramic acid kinase